MINDHTLYDFAIGKLLPPVIPFMPLLLKGLIMSIHHTSYVYVLWLLDTTFINEGNETCIDGLVNFEKMVIIL